MAIDMFSKIQKAITTTLEGIGSDESARIPGASLLDAGLLRGKERAAKVAKGELTEVKTALRDLLERPIQTESIARAITLSAGR